MSQDDNTEEDIPEEEVVSKKRFDPEALLSSDGEDRENDDAIYVDDMYGDWFLDYASMLFWNERFPILMMVLSLCKGGFYIPCANWRTVVTTKSQM